LRRLLLKNARCLLPEGPQAPRDLVVERGVVVERDPGADARVVDLGQRLVLPALVNAHDVLDLAASPPLGRPPYDSLYEWTRAVEDDAERLSGALALALPDRLFLGAIRNLLAGVASVLHHHADHRALAREDFPVRVQRRYAFAHSPGLTPALRRSYRTTDRRVPWLVRAAEGRDPALRAELDVLAAANVLRQNTVIAHGTALEAADGPRLAAARVSLAWCPESDLRLYGRTAPALALRAAGVLVGLGTDGAHAGARDLLSSLAVAGRGGGLRPGELLELATRGSADVARMPLGGFGAGAPADLLVTGSLEDLLAGRRSAVSLLLVRGEAAYGEPALVAAAASGEPVALQVDGAAMALAAALGRRLASLLRRCPAARKAAWLEGVAV
jgi:cytosine/adenosine deaminase-related metal-dependent hydrolase